MKKHELAARIARQTGISKAAAADRLDDLVHEVLTRLRNGHPTPLPGLGRFIPGEKPGFEFEKNLGKAARLAEAKESAE